MKIPHEIGTLEATDGRTFIRTEKGQSGFALYGPWEVYQPGIYSAVFDITSEVDVLSAGPVICGWAEITASSGRTVLEKTRLYVDRLRREKGRVVLNCELREAVDLEFRVYSTGTARLKVSTEVLVSRISEKGYEPVLRHGAPIADNFLRDNFEHFRFIYENGGQLESTEHGMVATCLDVSFYVKTAEDFQIANEIFFNHEYQCSLSRDVMAIDIGMNVGLASLYMARNPRVVEVHGFEPFRAPFQRALENLKLNPELRRKIVSENIGLGGASEELSVLSDAASTIGTSVRGITAGTPETIMIRSAVEIFEGLIARAAQNDWELVVKMDCEGSEFAILECLSKAGLTKHIRVLMVEWHKWWCADKSQRDIVEPLLDGDFVVFDRTTPANIYAGMLYAVRMG